MVLGPYESDSKPLCRDEVAVLWLVLRLVVRVCLADLGLGF